MSDRPEQDKPIMRYSELASDGAPGSNDSPKRAAPPAEDISFRTIKGLKGNGLSGSSGEQPGESSKVSVQQIMPDNRMADLFAQMTREVNRVYEAVRRGESFRIDPLYGIAESLAEHPSLGRLISQIFEHHQRTSYSDRNPAHCGIIAAQVGRGLGYAKPELVQVTVAAFLHDIGLQKLPPNLLEKASKLTADEFAMVQTHPELGHRLLTQHASKQPELAEIVRQEHEREGGQGYPRKLSAGDILDGAKVIGITDIYDALITPRPYRKAFCPHEAIKELLDCQERMGYARHVVRALIQQLSLFPPGCLVQLSSHEVARVIQTNSRSPLRPVVKVLYSEGQPLVSPRIVDLNDNPFVYIVTSLCEDAHASVSLAEATAG
jgi:HD-GYP domain-containing protein (c-di-GMP phosphodiesterase class II)